MSDPVEMSGGDFAAWAEQTYGVDFDDVRAWDMFRDPTDATRMPFDFEVSNEGTIPADLYNTLVARKTARVIQPRAPFVPTPDRWDFDGE